jgi:2'-5' RNA ligase
MRIRSWKPAQKSKPFLKVSEDSDEPVTQICGVENPFSGVYESDDDEAHTEDSIAFLDGEWFTRYQLSHHYHHYIFGKNSSKLRSLQKQLGTTIAVVELDTVEIRSTLKASVIQAVMYLSDRMKEVKLKYTHFVCFPLIGSGQLAKSIEAISTTIEDPVLMASAVSVSKLHFTICMLRLTSESDLKKVKDILENFSNLLGGRKIHVTLKGINSIQDDVSAARVLFTGADADSSPWRDELLQVASLVITRLENEGFIDSGKQKHVASPLNHVQLHATLFNIKYAIGRIAGVEDSSDDGTTGRSDWVPGVASKSSKKSFNAAGLIEKHKNTYFGAVDVGEIRLCSLIDEPQSSRTKPPDGFYKTELIVQL